MVLVVALHNLPEPCADVPRTMMLPVLKLCLYDVELRNHPLLRGEAPDIKSSAAREISAKMRESQKREGLGFPLATLLPVSDGEPPEHFNTELTPSGSCRSFGTGWLGSVWNYIRTRRV